MIKRLLDMRPKTIRFLFIVKLILVGAFLLISSGKLQLGDLAIMAANDESAADDLEYDTTPDSEGYVQGDKKRKKNKSLLDKLFSIPKTETKELKKDEIGRYMTILERKKKEINDRIEMLKEREETLTSIEITVDQKLKSLDDERRFFAETLQKEKTLKGERTGKLIEFYKKMSPKKAAPIFEKLDKDLVVELFNNMPEKQNRVILELMNAEKSVELTEYYGRIRSGREYDVLKELNKSLRAEFQDCKTQKL